MQYHISLAEKKKFGPFGLISVKLAGFNKLMTINHNGENSMTKVLVRSAFKGATNSAVPSRKLDQEKLRQIFPAVFAEAVTDKKLKASTQNATNITF